MKVVYAVFYNADSCEGRGPMVIDKVFSNRRDADFYMGEKPGVQGFKGATGGSEVREYPMFESLGEARQSDEKIKREKALSKLTEEDKRALGLV